MKQDEKKSAGEAMASHILAKDNGYKLMKIAEKYDITGFDRHFPYIIEVVEYYGFPKIPLDNAEALNAAFSTWKRVDNLDEFDDVRAAIEKYIEIVAINTTNRDV